MLVWFLAVQFAGQGIAIFIMWRIQRSWQLSTRTMLIVCAAGINFLDFWGMIGNWTSAVGYFNVWEFWWYNVAFGLFATPWYCYS